MDWTEKIEQKKKIRKMAYCMLWADFKDVVLGWKGILLVLMYIFYFMIPYSREVDDVNIAIVYYLVMWVITALSALAENSFNYLPLSTKDILYYLKCRTNHLTAWMVLVSVGSGLILDAFGTEMFWERGIISLLFLLATVEWHFFMALCGYSRQEKISLLESDIPKARKIRIVIFNIYYLVFIFANMIVAMFMDYNEHAKTKLFVFLIAYLVMYIFRADAARWVYFNEYRKATSRSLYNVQQGGLDAQNQQ